LLRVVQRAGEGNLLRVEEYLAREKDSGVALSEEEWSSEYEACCDTTPASSGADSRRQERALLRKQLGFETVTGT
jgi:hypothetical protein